MFEHFKSSKKSADPLSQTQEDTSKKDKSQAKFNFIQANYETLPTNYSIESSKLSKKRIKQLKRMKVSELKQIVKRPDVVELWDVTAPEPMFLIWLKTIRNSVPVPKHWAQKRKFLQYKRGVPKLPFLLPDFIEATGISRLRNLTGHDPGKVYILLLRLGITGYF